MNFIYPEAPMKYIEDIPAYKYGEWEGTKGCKFPPTRKIIHPIDHGIFIGYKFINL